MTNYTLNIKAQTTLNFSSQISFTDISVKDFNCLKRKLEHKSIVLIGESSHGVQEFGEFKKEIIKYLVDSLGFTTVLIESGMSDIYKWTAAGQNNFDSLVYSVFPVWQTSSYAEMFKYLYKRDIKVYGIDPQNSSKYFRDFPYEQLLKVDTGTAMKFYDLDKEWSKKYSRPIASWDSTLYQTQKKAVATYELVLKRININSGAFSDYQDYLFLKRILESRLSMAKAINKSPDYLHRDSIMTTNVMWIMENILSKDDKVIILSHNSHIAKERNMNVGYMGNLMQKSLGEKMFVIAQYFESGNFIDISRKVNSTPIPIRNSFEAYLNSLNSEYNLFDMGNSTLPKRIFKRKIKTYYMGGPLTQELILSKNYDLIFTVKHAKASNLIKLK